MSLPSLKCWLKAVRLAIPAYLGGVVFNFYFWLALSLWFVMMSASPGVEALAFLALPLVVLVMGILWALLLRALWFLVGRFLWSNPPGWLKESTWGEFWKGVVISHLATLPVFLVYLCLVSGRVAYRVWGGWSGGFPVLRPPVLIVELLWLWLLTAAYLYHFSRSRPNWVQTGLAKKRNPPTPR